LKYRYRQVLSEGTQPGFYILTVLANDLDEELNANLRYYLTGDGSDKFFLDPAAGNFPMLQTFVLKDFVKRKIKTCRFFLSKISSHKSLHCDKY
jgi:hypothetical protein